MKSLFLFLLRAYQLTISPYLGQNCRFYPSCSAYAAIAIRRHGVLRGCLLSGKRLCKCHPWHEGGTDLVPEAPINTEQRCDLGSKTGLKLARPESTAQTGSTRTGRKKINAAAEPAAISHAPAPAPNQPHFITE